jgi:hypothetical protein
VFLFLLLAVSAVGLAVAAGSSTADAAKKPPKKDPTRVPSPDGTAPTRIQGQRDVVTRDKWSCKAAKKQPLPDIDKIVPPQLVASGGPIAQAAKTMYDVVRKIFDAIGAKQVCTIPGGRYVHVISYKREDGDRKCDVWIEPMWGGGPAGEWHFSTTRGSDGPFDLVSKIEEPSAGALYLMNGGRPPSELWKHINIAKWQPYFSGEITTLDEDAHVMMQRKGDTLDVFAWLPPRAQKSHTGVFGAYIIDHPVTWRVSWAVA